MKANNLLQTETSAGQLMSLQTQWPELTLVHR